MKSDGGVEQCLLATMKRRLVEVEEQRRQGEYRARLCFSIALLVVSVSLVILAEKLGMSRTAHSHPQKQLNGKVFSQAQD
jgi:hypothetical protein